MSKGNKHDPLAQLDRARCYERRGREFESLTGHTRNFGRLGVCAGLKILKTRFESAGTDNDTLCIVFCVAFSLPMRTTHHRYSSVLLIETLNALQRLFC